MSHPSAPRVFVTGGAGYIGSHTCVELLNAGYDVIVFDNFCNSHPEALRRVARIAGQQFKVVEGDVRDKTALIAALKDSCAEAVIHFAGLKAVGESVSAPLKYYDNNVCGSVCLLEAMQACGIKTLVFSSSATVYGAPEYLPLSERHPLRAANPYGASKLMVENILRDLQGACPEWRIATLRYFNPVGAHESGLIGEDPYGIPNNLMPYISQVAVGRREYLSIFGNDYATKDGTGMRDYIHVMDLASGHIKALERLQKMSDSFTTNLGTGRGYSVLEMVRAFEMASGRAIPYRIAPRRSGDVASCYADPKLANKLLEWKASRDLEAMCVDTWRWQLDNPDGYSRKG